ncbi:hypothetical protein PCANC_00015 [Puccinia coronata f. sp. avenae]|uniref:Secreted protein n=1 Tax=Puccinia coronata f. sp. avenae TaxID=200324 RepID=A0A2N5W8P2_9BASI|nr:hypothetical protein PCANC_00015 [Puccinia coronata f. sp. avenae]
MAFLVFLLTAWLSFAGLPNAKLIPQAQLCGSYTNAYTNQATCGKLVCPYGCSWPFITAENCSPVGAASANMNTTSQTCHIAFSRVNNQLATCVTKFGTYQCTGGTTGFAACTGCHS